ncbi:hypothetical protein IU436_29835 [Nocardia farcinica]|uniref:DUF6573 family protein n=1 Tax=Nocardia TaxID=1817 RepID=UPI0018954A77|nr:MULTISPECIES: DUF6573 family protein [Nocardia]MBF6216404.1 hypothetical protein [Nocardia puris]MBF6422905.1 hypothetical protein [Nocardia farcinica]MBF6434522.1 hypothetical protein [Nocardia farcinica]MBF6505607.1 hypothetical protein [Nocardia farcinica]
MSDQNAHALSLTDLFGPVISSYTRADALADGTLHDLTDLAKEAGFLKPVHIAAYAWADAVSWPHSSGLQDETGRAWDVLMTAMRAIRIAVRQQHDTAVVEFTVLRISDPEATEPTPCELAIEIGPGDDGEPVFTITAPLDR